MSESNTNPKLNYRVPKDVTDEFKKTCDEQAIDPGKLIQKWMKEFIERTGK
jgi:hypothetical protein